MLKKKKKWFWGWICGCGHICGELGKEKPEFFILFFIYFCLFCLFLLFTCFFLLTTLYVKYLFLLSYVVANIFSMKANFSSGFCFFLLHRIFMHL